MKKLIVMAAALVLLGTLTVIFTGCSLGVKTVVEEKSYDITDSFDKIEVNADVADVEVLPAVDGGCRVDVCGNRKVSYSAAVSDGVLIITERDDRAWYQKIIPGFGESRITVYLPNLEYSSFAVDAATSDVDIKGSFNFGIFDLAVSTGDIEIEGITADAVSIKVSTGDVELENVICSGEIKHKCSTGKLEARDITAGSVSTVGSSGDVEMERLTVSGEVAVERDTGELEIYGAIMGGIVTKTSTGCVVMERVSAAGDIVLESSTGDITLTEIKCSSFSQSSSTGDLRISNAECETFNSSASSSKLCMTSLIVSGTLTAERDSGDVTLDGCDANEIFITTDTGDVRGTLLTDKVFITRTDTGEIDVPETITGGKCKITTDTGDIKIEYK